MYLIFRVETGQVKAGFLHAIMALDDAHARLLSG